MVSEEKESRPFQTGRTDEAHYFFWLIECGNWPVRYFTYGEGAKLLLPFFKWRWKSEPAPPALLPDLFTMQPEGNRYWFNLSRMVVNQQVYKLLIDRIIECIVPLNSMILNITEMLLKELLVNERVVLVNQAVFSFIITEQVINLMP